MACALATAALVLSGCGLFSGPEEDKTANWSADKLYSEAHVEMDTGAYSQAVKYLKSLQTRFPFGRYAQQALLEECYAQWKDYEPEAAIAACDRFIKQYPNSPHIDYAYYLKGLINFNGDLGFLGKYAGQDPSERDPKALRDSFESLREVTVRFPDSRYTPDSLLRMRYLVNAMAAHEIHVASYYLRRGALIAAVARAKRVVVDFQQTPSTEDALEIMIVAYGQLNLPELRDDAQRVMALNYPNHVPGKFVVVPKAWWKIW